MTDTTHIPDRLFQILRTVEEGGFARFPPTEVFNEGWMLRLVLDAFESLEIRAHPLSFELGSRWFSEARLESPFRPRMRADNLGEGPTNADAVIAKLGLRSSMRAGLSLSSDSGQFVVVEAKMFSNLSAGTKNAPNYNQAARNVACMAEAIAKSGRTLSEFASVGFYVLAPCIEIRAGRASNLEASMKVDAIKMAIRERIASYEALSRPEVAELQNWEAQYLLPLVDRLCEGRALSVLSWEDCIESIAATDAKMGAELASFYKRCLAFAPSLGAT